MTDQTESSEVYASDDAAEPVAERPTGTAVYEESTNVVAPETRAEYNSLREKLAAAGNNASLADKARFRKLTPHITQGAAHPDATPGHAEPDPMSEH